MPIFMDVHESLGEASAEDVADAHSRDLAMQDEFGVRWLTYWFNDADGKAFCLVESPDTDSAVACHKAAHGLTPHRMIEVSGDSLAGFFGEWKTEADRVVLDSALTPDPALRAIFFTDIVGSTEVSSRQGDAAAVRMVAEHDAIVRSGLEELGGREVKHTGDGILASFPSVSRSVACAITIQRSIRSLADDTGSGLRVSIGISAGEPVAQSDDLFGAAVNLAARLCDHANADQILVSNAVRDLCIGKPIAFVDAGVIAAKGFDDPVSVSLVDWAT
ncbi:MAG: nickel-binding protein [Acidimicrobiia bacterium]